MQCETEDLIPGSVARPSGEVNGNPLQYSCLENSMDRGACQDTVHEETKRVRHDIVTKPPPPLNQTARFNI